MSNDIINTKILHENLAITKRCMKIAYSGTHGTGKTTRVFEKAKELKVKFPKKTVGVLSENVIHCPLPVNKETTTLSQLWIFCDQMKNEIEMSTRFDILVCDRSIFDSIAYMWRIDRETAESLLEVGRRFLDTYDVIYFLRAKNNEYLVENELRNGTDREFREEIDRILEEIYFKKLKCDNVIEI